MSFDYSAGVEFDSIMMLVLLIYGVFALIMTLFSVACYVLSSLSMHTIAKRRGIHHPWLSWIPYGNMWILGSIADQYQYVTKGKVKNRRKVLLGVTLALAVLLIPIVVFTILLTMGVSLAVVLIVLSYVALIVLSIVGSVFQYIAYYDLFRSCRPESATLFLVLGIVFPATLPFFLLACRNQDKGMPPRKSQIPPVIPSLEEMFDMEQPE